MDQFWFHIDFTEGKVLRIWEYKNIKYENYKYNYYKNNIIILFSLTLRNKNVFPINHCSNLLIFINSIFFSLPYCFCHATRHLKYTKSFLNFHNFRGTYIPLIIGRNRSIFREVKRKESKFRIQFSIQIHYRLCHSCWPIMQCGFWHCSGLTAQQVYKTGEPLLEKG